MSRAAYTEVLDALGFGTALAPGLGRVAQALDARRSVWLVRERGLRLELLFEPSLAGWDAEGFDVLALDGVDRRGAPTLGAVVRSDALAREAAGLAASELVPSRYLPIGWQDAGEAVYYVDKVGRIYTARVSPQEPWLGSHEALEQVGVLPR